MAKKKAASKSVVIKGVTETPKKPAKKLETIQVPKFMVKEERPINSLLVLDGIIYTLLGGGKMECDGVKYNIKAV